MDNLLGTKANVSAPSQPFVKDVTVKSFVADVIEASMGALVLVDFWAPWCGPCKQLVPALEKLVASYGGAVTLAKVNVDQEPHIAQQMGVQSVPAVFAFYKKQPVDGFMGAQPEAQVKTWVDTLIDKLGITVSAGGIENIKSQLDQAEAFFAEGNFQAAQSIFMDVNDVAADNVTAYAGILRCLIAQEQLDQAQKLLDHAAPEMLKDKEVQSCAAALQMVAEANKVVQQAEALALEVEKNPTNHQARFDLSLAYFATNQREKTIDHLLEIVQRDRMWNDEAARKQLVKCFEAFGATNPLTISARKRLSSILFS